MVSNGFHKTQCLWSGQWNVVHPALLESANGGALIGGRRSAMEPVEGQLEGHLNHGCISASECSPVIVKLLNNGIEILYYLLKFFCREG